MERGLMMLLHSIIIGLILYIVMVFAFKQNDKVAENRSILITAVILIYMILFGHSIPDKLNSDL
jgi:ACR3 family arsenite efflux pump ArsB